MSVVDLGHNKLTYVPGFIAQKSTLTDLYMDMNYLNGTQSLLNLTALVHLDMSSNAITAVSKHFFEVEHPNLKLVSLAQNPFHCGCQFENTDQYLNVSNITLIMRNSHVCHSPASMKNMVIFDFHPSPWDCHLKNELVPFICVTLTLICILVLCVMLRKRNSCRTQAIEWNTSCCTNCYSKLRHTEVNEFTENQKLLKANEHSTVSPITHVCGGRESPARAVYTRCYFEGVYANYRHPGRPRVWNPGYDLP